MLKMIGNFHVKKKKKGWKGLTEVICPPLLKQE